MKEKLYKKILVIRFSSLGDVILTTPLLKKIKQIYPGSEIHYLTKNSFSDIIRHNPNISKIIETNDKIDFNELKTLRKRIQSEKYDLILDAHNNLRTFYLRLFSDADRKVFRKYSFRKFLLIKLKINLMKDLPPITERYCNMLRGDNPVLLPEIYTDESSKVKVDTLIQKFNPAGKKIICISPSSHHFTKTYPADYYSALINKLGNQYLFLITGKGKDISNISKIMSQTGDNTINLCDKLSLPELAQLIRRSDLFISGDTGPMHIAEASGKNLIMMAGSSVKEFGFYPQNINSAVFENNLLKCRPCSHIGRQDCPKVHFNCMKKIKAEEVYSSALNFLSNL